jgi:hypothetical protein
MVVEGAQSSDTGPNRNIKVFLVFAKDKEDVRVVEIIQEVIAAAHIVMERNKIR